ncbi:MAG TPA: malto-oligosyltrehalose trehalohydrolase [Lacisediminihabitans sp.]|uniref:malto-oligosyltrehalose trehalohydrolase n=1 Tax=Lacisediminihabitans sp. TaxID=2787631 RepID=UPI002ED97339
MSFEVWAPAAATVRLLLDGTGHPMVAVGDGWWSAPEGLTGADYGYLIDDDEKPLPDPRSRRQPESVHGLSRTVDPGAFVWSDERWTGRQLPGGVIYELHLGTFTPEGTLEAAIGRLDHLVSIGVDFVELLPVNGFNGDHNWGYDGVLWYTVDETYGGPAAYQRFVDACHRRGLAVVQDVVYNHLGPSGNYLPRFGPYLREGSANTWGASINLDEPAVRRYIVDNALMWLRDYHVDALRLDAVHALVDDSPKHILQELAEEADALSAFLGRPLSLIAESDLNDPRLITPREGGGYGLTGQWSDDFHHAVHVALTGETTGYYADFEHLDALAKVLTRGFFHDGTYSSFRERDHGHPIVTATMPTWRLVVANQNHDQIGNRAVGDRLSSRLDRGQLAIAAALTLAGPFTPMLFMGEEWGATTPWQFFTAHPEPELGEATAKGRIAEFERMGWDPDIVPDPQDPDTFHRSKLDWDQATAAGHSELLAFYRGLAALRRERPDLTDPRFDRVSCEFDDEQKWFVVHRGLTSIVVNFADYPIALPVGGSVLLASSADAGASESEVVLPGHCVVILARSAPATEADPPTD